VGAIRVPERFPHHPKLSITDNKMSTIHQEKMSRISPMFYTRNCLDIPAFRDDTLQRAFSRMPKVAPIKKEKVHVPFGQVMLDLGPIEIRD